MSQPDMPGLLKSLMRRLVITEKFSTALRIAVVLSSGKMKREKQGPVAVFSFEREGDDFTVMGLRGHIVELDYPEELNQWNMETLPKLVDASPIRSITEAGIVEVLRRIAPQHDEVILATDWDREGEVIAAEALEIILEVNPKIVVTRAQYSAMSKSEIEKAFSELKTLDRNLADAGMARQNIDLMWGALLTRYLTLVTRTGGGGTYGHSSVLSAGRVQTPTLALLVDRDKEIKNFVPQPFWEISVTGEYDGQTFTLRHTHGRWFDKKEADAVLQKMTGAKTGTVRDFTEEEDHVRPPVPFNTTLFLADATRLGISASQAMRIAEDLYTGGVISYPRTDNTVYPRTLGLRGILEMLSEGFLAKEAKYVLSQEKLRATRGRQETTDHPPIYPTGKMESKSSSTDRGRIYELVARRFLATTAPDAVGIRRKAAALVAEEELAGEGFRLTDRGWYDVYPYYEPRESDFPRLKANISFKILEIQMHEGKTEPPRRYSQGGLIQEMEKLGLGTKSTRHEIIQKLVERRYIMPKGLEPTSSGLAVTEALETNASLVTRPEMTSRLEEDMTSIAEGQKTLDGIVTESRDMLREVYRLLQENQEGVRDTITGALDAQHFIGLCAKCGGALRMHTSPRGRRWIQCANNPRSCTASYQLPSSGHIEAAKEICPKCKVPMARIIHRGQRPKNYCINSECEAHQEEFAIGTCPQCGSPLHIKYSFRGKRFVSCTGFPNCRVSYPLPQNGRLDRHPDPCPTCGAPIVTVIRSGRPPWTICINMECSSRKQSYIASSTVDKPKEEVRAAPKKPSGRKRSTSNVQRSGNRRPRTPSAG